MLLVRAPAWHEAFRESETDDLASSGSSGSAVKTHNILDEEHGGGISSLKDVDEDHVKWSDGEGKPSHRHEQQKHKPSRPRPQRVVAPGRSSECTYLVDWSSHDLLRVSHMHHCYSIVLQFSQARRSSFQVIIRPSNDDAVNHVHQLVSQRMYHWITSWSVGRVARQETRGCQVERNQRAVRLQDGGSLQATTPTHPQAIRRTSRRWVTKSASISRN